MTMLSIRNVSVYYGKARVLSDVSLEVEEGESVAIIGPNGAGKTTLLRAISGLIRPIAGDIYYDGHRLGVVPPHEMVHLGIAHVPEGRRLAPRMSVRENLELGAYHRRDHDAIARDMTRVFTMFPRLEERLDQYAGRLSGGERQMLAIGRALMAAPRFMLLDEPSLGLAPLLKRLIFDSIAEIRASGVTILLAEQDASLALPAVTRAYVLESGRVVLQGNCRQLRTNDYVRKTYLGVGT